MAGHRSKARAGNNFQKRAAVVPAKRRDPYRVMPDVDEKACSSARVSAEPAVVMGPCVRRDDGGVCGYVLEQPATIFKSPPNLHCRPGERRDPYRVMPDVDEKACSSARASADRLWLRVPAFAGTTAQLKTAPNPVRRA